MGAFLSYSITSGLMMLAMYLAYRIFLARDNQHSFNRAVLLLIYFVSFAAVPAILPLINANDMTGTGAETMTQLDFIGATAEPVNKPVWAMILLIIYIAGMTIAAALTVATWIRLINVIRKGKKTERGGYTLVVTEDEKYAPFSWMRYVVISREDYSKGYQAIAVHEFKHVSARHWIDLLAAQTVCIINWFNPAAWLMRDELMLVHEFQADMAVIDSGHDTQEYQMLLIKKAVGSRFPSLANSLNHSKLNKRITMMYKAKSSAGRKFKALALVPTLALALCVASVPAVRAAVTTIGSSDVTVGKGSENLPKDKTTVRYYRVTNLNDSGSETTAVIAGEGLGNSLTVTGVTITNDGKTYQAKSIQCNLTKGSATITATFPFSGKLKKASMILTANGEEIPFNLENFVADAHSVSIGKTSGNQDGSIVSNNGNALSVLGNMTILLDGKEISDSELKALPASNIASITVDKQNMTLIVKSK
ncbi:MAG: hypothetical protein K2M19_05780 [Muribaculaceae bacterium]|nr:hypothetical protein [Muribaculaceae bacterium]